MNLTNQQRLQVFHIYSNATVLFDNGGWKISCIESYSRVKLKNHGGTWITDLSACQLILRGIDQLTEDEKRELTQIIGTEHNSIDLDDGKLCWKYRGIFNGYIDLKELPYPAVDYLRSLEPPVSLPFYIEGKVVDLFESGVAKRIKP